MHPVVKLPNVEMNRPEFYLLKEGLTQQAFPYDIGTTMRVRVVRRTKLENIESSAAHAQAIQGRNYGERTEVLRVSTISYNTAYDRFIGKLGSSSSFGATLTAERRETFGMISGFVVRFIQSMRCARRGDILGVFHNLGFNPPLKRVTRTYYRKRKWKGRKGLQPPRRKVVTGEYYTMPDGRMVLHAGANAWLLWSYGVSPLMGDIQNATDVFIRDVPDYTVIKAGCKTPLKVYNKSDFSVRWQSERIDGSIRTGITSQVRVTNYDLWLANQLGLINPVQFLNEAVPFSFVIDWFSNWSSVINSLTDTVGLSLTGTCISTKKEFTVNRIYWSKDQYGKPRTEIHNFSVMDYRRDMRALGPPTLIFELERFQWQRGLNAISLLIGLGLGTSKK